MARRRYLVAYDISDPRRLRQVCKVMEEYGMRLQYSVFLCDLSEREHIQWLARVREEMNLHADSVVEVDLGDIGRCAKVVAHGRPRAMPTSGPTIF